MSDEAAAPADAAPAGSRLAVGQVALVALFVTALVTAQLLAVKLMPVSFPGTDFSVLVPAGVVAYALTFFATDCYAELYGYRSAQRLVNVGFVMILVMLGLVWAAILAPGSNAGVDPQAFASVMGPSTNIVVGGLLAYVVSQNWDVFAFDFLREYTAGEYLWLRNVGSTATSQAIDTTIFAVTAFFVLPAAIGIGTSLPLDALGALILGQYTVKLLIAVLDTPFVYAVVGAVPARETATPGTRTGD